MPAHTTSPTCIYCQRHLVGQFYRNHWGEAFCIEHQTNYVQCSFCGRLIPPSTGRRLTTHAISCERCNASAIDTTAHAEPLFRKLVIWFRAQGLGCDTRLQIELADQQHFVHDGATSQALGLAVQLVDQRGTRTGVVKIAVLRGMPATVFDGVAAHELAHVWSALKIRSALPQWLEEGLAELIAHRRYIYLNTKYSLYQAERIAQNRDPIYGDGTSTDCVIPSDE